MADASFASSCISGVLTLTLLWLHSIAASETVYFDKYGHCQRNEPFDLSDDEYILEPVGGGFAHETLVCDVTFKAPQNYGICLTFEKFKITDCRVRVKIYSSQTSSGIAWRTLDCGSSKPGQMCTAQRFVTVQVVKYALNANRGYEFKIQMEKSTSVSEEGVLFASIGVFVGIILAVVVLLVMMSIIIVYCCCKRRKEKKKREMQAAEQEAQGRLVEPSAPPADLDDDPRARIPDSHQYPQLHNFPQEPPPPYVPPPSYEVEDSSTQRRQYDSTEQTYPMKH